MRLRELIESAAIKAPKEPVALDFEPWQHLLDVQVLLGGYLRKIGDPGETMG